MKNLNNINNFRRTDLYGDGFVGDDYNGAFIIDKYKNGEFYLVIASNGQGWDHVSVSMHRKNDKGKIIKYFIFNVKILLVMYWNIYVKKNTLKYFLIIF